MEHYEHQAEYIERCHHRGHRPDQPEEEVSFGESSQEDFIFTEEASERENAGDGERRDQKGRVGDRQMFLQPAHTADVLFTTEGMHDAASAQEQQGFEKRVGDEMENRRRKGTDAAKIAVSTPMIATMLSAAGAIRYSTEQRATMYTPAVTMVAAWISALTGVGPSMASGNQTYSGICADLPVAPRKSSNVMAVTISPPGINCCAARP